MSVWVLVVIGIAAFIVLVLLILAVPVDIELLFDSQAKCKLRLRMIWLFGLFSQEIGQHKQKRRKKIKSRMDVQAAWRVLKIQGFFRHLKRLIKRIFRQIRVKALAVNIKIGFDDPADGGMIFAVIGAVKPLIGQPERFEFEVQPVFSNHSFVDGYVRCVFQIQPLSFIFSFLQWIFSVPTLKMVGIMVSSMWKNRSRKRVVTRVITAA